MKVGDFEFNVQIMGEGKPFLWAHGLNASIEAEDILDWFEWEKFPPTVKLVRYDARGHGKSQFSPDVADYHWRRLGEDMLKIGAAVSAEPFIAGGDSMGCATAIYAALLAPERVRGLVLALPPAFWERRAAQGKSQRRAAAIVRLLGRFGDGLLKRMLSSSAGSALPGWLVQAEPEMAQRMAAMTRLLNPRTMAITMQGAAETDLPPREELRALANIPALILAWVDDPTHPVESAEELHRLLPASELFIIRSYDDYKKMPGCIRDFVVSLN